MPDESRLAQLLVKLVCRDLSDEGKVELDGWRVASAQNEAFLQRVTSDTSIIDDLKVFIGMDKASLLEKIDAGIRENEPLPEPIPFPVLQARPFIRRLKPWLWGAAAVVLACLILTYLLKAPGKEDLTAMHPTGGPVDHFFSQKAPDSGAVQLTLGDGGVRSLDSLKNGVVARQGTVDVHIAEDGKLLKYATVVAGPGSSEVFNTLTVPYGSRFKLQLSDGTKVKLNVGSSIRYPVAFTGDKRTVEVTGEVFFDVAPDSRHPFIVKAHKEEVEVLGTDFVVSDYPGEQHAKVVVASGLVSVRSGKDSISILHPSQGVRIAEGGEIKIDPDMDIRSVLALKEEYFNFDGLDRKAALTLLAQSYHMRILFDDNIENGPFGSGNIQRDLPLKRLLNDLELPDLHFRIRMQDNTIIVTR
ncbi:MAG TPA: FecR domain-containing protein [Puia sp.]|nr:FecR domain-containing protein [Puia sp.]